MYSHCSHTSTFKSWASLSFSCTCSENSHIKRILQSDFFLLRKNLLNEPEENCIRSQMRTLILSTSMYLSLFCNIFHYARQYLNFLLFKLYIQHSLHLDVTSQRKQKLLGKKKKKNPSTFESHNQTVSLFSKIYLIFWLWWVFVGTCGLSLVAESNQSGGYSSLRCVSFASVASLVAEQRLQHTGLQELRRRAQQLWCTCLAGPQHVESAQTRDQTGIPCIARQILNHLNTGG